MSHPRVHLKCLTTFPHSPSRGSICGPLGPTAGLSHAPSARAAQARSSGHDPAPASPVGQPSPPSPPSPPSLSPSGALPLSSCLPASRIPSHGQTRVNAVASPHEPGSSSANIWRTTRTDLTLCTSEHVNDSVKWEVKGIKAVCAENMAFCYKLVIENRSSAPVTLCNVNILRHCIRSCIHKGLKISLDQYLLKCCNCIRP